MSDNKEVTKNDADPELEDLLDTWSKKQELTAVICDPKISVKLKELICKSIIGPVMLYGCETWPALTRHIRELYANELDVRNYETRPSALQDMTKQPAKPAEVAPANPEDVQPNMWSEEFIKEAAAQFETNMAAILGSIGGLQEEQITQDQIAQTFTKMAEAAAQVLKPTADGVEDSNPSNDPAVKDKIDEVTAAISATLQNLSTNAESLQTPMTDQDLASMFSSFNMADGAGQQDGNMFVPFMQGMMQSLLSKEVLYPSLKELVEKYPSWLQDNKGKIPTEEYERFSRQQELMKQVCAELEPEQDSDPEDVKRKRFEIVLDLMQKMQDLGQPPTELVGDMAVPPQGFAVPPGQDGQCSVM